MFHGFTHVNFKYRITYCRVASRREPPAPKELDSEERSGGVGNTVKTGVRISYWPVMSPMLKPCGPQLGPKLPPGSKLGRSWGLVGRN